MRSLFVIDDILIANVVLPFLQGLGQHTLEKGYEWLDDQGIQFASGFLRRVREHGQRDGDTEEFVEQLGRYVEQHRGAAAELTAHVIETADTRGDDEFVQVVQTFLVATFRLAGQLGSPAVVPGFLTGEQHLAVIDVRTRGKNEKLQVPRVDGGNRPTIEMIWRGPSSVTERPALGRIWLVDAAASDRKALEDLSATASPYVSSDLRDSFMTAMDKRLLVTEVARDLVVAQPSVAITGGNIMVLGATEQFRWTENPLEAGAMYNTLAASVTAYVEKEQQWRAEWSRALLVSG